jgi:SAM-dependent methyltransferase
MGKRPGKGKVMTDQLASAPKVPWQERYLDRFYGNRPNWIDGTSEFHEMIRRHLPTEGQVLELGSGPQNHTSDFLAETFAALDGLDVDEKARGNPALRQFFLYQGGPWPIADSNYDAVVANYVLEHLENPAATIAEVARVLHPGGLFLFRTPNLLHYVTMVSWLTPHWFHKLVANRLRNLSAEAHDPYPTFYRMNRCRKIRALARRAGLEEVQLYTCEKEPSYGMASRVLFLLFMAYERVVNSSELFSTFRASIVGALRKPKT